MKRGRFALDRIYRSKGVKMGIFDKLFKREPSIKELKERGNIKKLIEALGSDTKRIE